MFICKRKLVLFLIFNTCKRKAIVPSHGATKSEQPEVWGQLLEKYCEMLYPDAMYLHIYEPCADASIGLSGP